MKKVFLGATMIAALLTGLVSCGPKATTETADAKDSLVCLDDGHNSQNSLNWEGTYEGTIPCADCEGIDVSLTLNADETYQISYTYLGKGDSKPDVTTGKFTWDTTGGIVKLDDKYLPPYYRVGENRLQQLDMEGNVIDGAFADMYFLNKVSE